MHFVREKRQRFFLCLRLKTKSLKKGFVFLKDMVKYMSRK